MSSDVAARTDDDLDFEPDPDQEMSKPPHEEDEDELGQIKFVSVSKLRYYTKLENIPKQSSLAYLIFAFYFVFF